MPTTILVELKNASPSCEPASKVQYLVCANSCDRVLLPDGKKTAHLIPSLRHCCTSCHATPYTHAMPCLPILITIFLGAAYIWGLCCHS